MFKCFNKMSLFLPMVKTVHFSASTQYFNKPRFVSTTPRRDFISSSQCLQQFQFKCPLTKEQQVQFVKDFEESASNKDGGLSEDEFKKAIKKSVDWLSDSQIHSIWEQSKGFEDPAKLPPMNKKQYIEQIQKILTFRKHVDESAKHGFTKHDADQDGKLAPQEVTDLIEQMQGLLSKGKDKKAVHDDILKFDKDGDGKVNLDEFKEYFWFGADRDPFSPPKK